MSSAPIPLAPVTCTSTSPTGSPTTSVHFTGSTMRLYYSPKTLQSDGSFQEALSYASSNALSSADSAELTDDVVASSLYAAPLRDSSSSSSTDALDDDFYAHCHEQFGLPPFADTTILIFGYGSILWKQDFESTKAYEVYIKDYKRVFFQSSTNHRGNEQFPGRCVTLLPTSCFPAYTEADMDPEALASRSSLVREPGLEGSKHENRVYGKAYQLPSEPAKMYEIMKSLDIREGGYDCVRATVFDAAHERLTSEEVEVDATSESGERKKHVVCLCYIATTESEDFVGDAPLTDMATQMLDAVGFSGPNSEYLFLLAEKLQEMGAPDPHVFGLAAEARRLLEARERELASIL